MTSNHISNLKDNNIIVGLAGHIDHGKTSLIKALNNFDGDSLKEEKERGITLDISFSNLEINGKNIAFIDVPGHEKLVKNMIAGAFGVDVLLLVVAANESIMPQSIEHVNIANLLGIKKCICVITKSDKADDKQIESVTNDIKNLFNGTNIGLDSILTCSIFDNQSIENVKNALSNITKPKRDEFGLLLYYIDRAFSIKGAGCVVSGSIISGEIDKNDKLSIYDINKEVSIKSIHVHQNQKEKAFVGQRVALNLNGVESKDLKRGMLISKRGYLRGFDTLDCVLNVFNNINLLHNAKYQFFIGSKKCNVKLTILKEFQDSRYYVNLKSDEQIFAVFNQRFILRDGQQSIAGGIILNPVADPIKKNHKTLIMNNLENKAFEKVFIQMSEIHKFGFGLVGATQRFNLSHQEALEIANKLDLIVDQKELIIYPKSTINHVKRGILDVIDKNKNALMSPQSMKLKLKWASTYILNLAFEELYENRQISKKDNLFVSNHFDIQNIEEFLSTKILNILEEQNFTPMAPYNIYDMLDIPRQNGDAVFKRLTSAHKVIRLDHNLFISSKSLNAILAIMREIIKINGFIDIYAFKEKLPISRKYLVAYLDYLDKFNDIEKIENKRFIKG